MIDKRPFKIGDVVELNSGGTPMTVIAVEDDSIQCVWIDKTGKDRERKYPETALNFCTTSRADMTLIMVTSEEEAQLYMHPEIGHA